MQSTKQISSINNLLSENNTSPLKLFESVKSPLQPAEDRVHIDGEFSLDRIKDLVQSALAPCITQIELCNLLPQQVTVLSPLLSSKKQIERLKLDNLSTSTVQEISRLATIFNIGKLVISNMEREAIEELRLQPQCLVINDSNIKNIIPLFCKENKINSLCLKDPLSRSDTYLQNLFAQPLCKINNIATYSPAPKIAQLLSRIQVVNTITSLGFFNCQFPQVTVLMQTLFHPQNRVVQLAVRGLETPPQTVAFINCKLLDSRNKITRLNFGDMHPDSTKNLSGLILHKILHLELIHPDKDLLDNLLLDFNNECRLETLVLDANAEMVTHALSHLRDAQDRAVRKIKLLVFKSCSKMLPKSLLQQITSYNSLPDLSKQNSNPTSQKKRGLTEPQDDPPAKRIKQQKLGEQ